MINKNELIIVVDKDNKPLEPLPRHIVHEKNLWHRTTGIWIINKNKQILCEKRSIKKDHNPGLWESSFGGHVLANETYLENAVDELSEELGIHPNKKDLIEYKTFATDNKNHKKFECIFIYLLDREDLNFEYEKEELDELKWLNLIEIKKLFFEDKDPNWVYNSWYEDVISFIENL